MSGLKYVLSLVVLCVVHVSIAQAKFSVEKAVHKFPTTQEGKMLSHEFKITNSGNAPLIINDYEVGCPCTKVILPEAPILPGETIDLKVTFDTKGKYYFQDRTIYLMTNTKKKKHAIRIKVKVIPAE